MAAYHKVEVSLNTNAVEVGIPSPQSVTVTVPTVGPVGPQGPAGPKGDPGEVSGSIAWDNVTDKPSTFIPSSHTHVAADVTDFNTAVAAVAPPTTDASLLTSGTLNDARLSSAVTASLGKADSASQPGHSHVASDITDFTSAVEAVSPPADWDTLANKPASFTPSAHGSSHHTGGTDAMAAHQINGQTIFGTGSATYSTDQTLGASRALQLTVSNTNASGINLTLPTQSDGTLNGDTYVIIGGSTVSGPITIRRINLFSPLTYQTLATITATGQQYRFRATGATTGGWTLVPVDTHTHTFGTTAGTFAEGNDARLSDSRTPTSHAASHAAAGSDPVFDQDLNTTDTPTFSSLTVGGTVDFDGAFLQNFAFNNSVGLKEGGQELTGTLRVENDSLTANRTYDLPDASGTLALTSDFASPPAIGNTTPAAGTFTTLSANNGTLTASAPVLNLSQTWNASGVQFTGLQQTITNTASAAGSRLFNFVVGSTNVLSARTMVGVGPEEALAINGGSRGLVFGSNAVTNPNAAFFTMRWQVNLAGFNSSAILTWGADVYNVNYDLAVQRDAADTFAQRRGTNPQTFRLYNTFTSATNFERLNVRWASNELIIDAEAGGAGGTLRGIKLGSATSSLLGFYGATPVDQPATVADPAGGGTVDTEARTAINDIIDRLQELGLIA